MAGSRPVVQGHPANLLAYSLQELGTNQKIRPLTYVPKSVMLGIK